MWSQGARGSRCPRRMRCASDGSCSITNADRHMPPFGTSVIDREVPDGGYANRQNARSVVMLARASLGISVLPLALRSCSNTRRGVLAGHAPATIGEAHARAPGPAASPAAATNRDGPGSSTDPPPPRASARPHRLSQLRADPSARSPTGRPRRPPRDDCARTGRLGGRTRRLLNRRRVPEMPTERGRDVSPDRSPGGRPLR